MGTATPVTSEEFLARPDEFDHNGSRVKEELIAGEIVRVPPPCWRHDLRKNLIARIVGRYLDNAPQLRLDVLVEVAFEVSGHDTLTPDVSVVRLERMAQAGRLLKGAPEIAIEVISPFDTVAGLRAKIKAYLENGAISVVVFYDDVSVAVHTASGVRELKGDQALEDALLPGFSVPVSRFFA